VPEAAEAVPAPRAGLVARAERPAVRAAADPAQPGGQAGRWAAVRVVPEAAGQVGQAASAPPPPTAVVVAAGPAQGCAGGCLAGSQVQCWRRIC